ncbi:leucyl aminopeptidase [Saccharibacter sp. 17.LH.SD]|uniref:leucyl aminopeptidase n=1 Tax=Saccharibacter sp. 17.LH.SD TaxID=2689393 RepID=UPI00136D44CF|nr:leucyl aminopeptidase [Saccharibacter sp. 17.LH.SD]MXV44770.1 leucyl aminopeptidase [Saccharibacter sp. 17.LH.SD]
MLQLSFDVFSPSDVNTPLSVALLCFGEDATKMAAFKRLDEITGGALLRAVTLRGFKGSYGQNLSVLAPVEQIAQVQLIGCKTTNEFNLSESYLMEEVGGAALRALEKSSLAGTQGVIVLPEGMAAHAADVALGARLTSYHFTKYLSEKQKPGVFDTLSIALSTEEEVETALSRWAELEAVGDGVLLTRDLVNEPSNVLYPESFKNRIEALRDLGLEIEVLDQTQMEALGFGALLGVAQGSEREPYTVIMRYQGAASAQEAPLAFVGKGVTFDSGGISIKPAAGMDEMKNDMGGAATVVGVMSTLARRKAEVNAVGVVGLVENMVSGKAQRPGDIVKSYSGQTIEVLNTDAEGRLVLADLLAYTRKTYAPSFMINLATLTGAIVVALGAEHAGLFSNHDRLAQALEDAGKEVGEKLWRMPMGSAYNRQLDSDIADVKNIGGRPGSAILAAEFLKRFVGDTPWAHLDIAGTAWLDKESALARRGATGFGVQLLDRFVQDHETQN